MAKEIETKVYAVLGLGRDLVKPIEGRGDAPLTALEIDDEDEDNPEIQAA